MKIEQKRKAKEAAEQIGSLQKGARNVKNPAVKEAIYVSDGDMVVNKLIRSCKNFA